MIGGIRIRLCLNHLNHHELIKLSSTDVDVLVQI